MELLVKQTIETTNAEYLTETYVYKLSIIKEDGVFMRLLANVYDMTGNYIGNCHYGSDYSCSATMDIVTIIDVFNQIVEHVKLTYNGITEN